MSKQMLLWAGVALLLLGLWTWQTIQEDAAGSTQTAITASSPSTGSDDVRIDLWADKSMLSYRARLRFWIGIHNPGSVPIQVSFATFETPGFERLAGKPNCWQAGFPVCVVSGPTRVPTRLPVTIGPGDTVALEGDLRATADAGRYALSAVVVWQKAVGKTAITRRKPVQLRPVVVEHPVWSKTLLFFRALQNFLKDLALPLAVAFLGFWLKEKEDARSRQRQHEEQSQMEQKKAAAEKNAQVQQTWNLMLPKSHQNAERHYMPLAGTAERIAGYWKQFTDATDEPEQTRFRNLCFFSLLLFLSRMRRMTRHRRVLLQGSCW